MTRRILLLTLLGGLWAAAPAVAAEVKATASGDFDPNTVTITVGEKVTWTNEDGLHNVHFDDDSFQQPLAPSLEHWTAERTFTSAGTFRYFCDQHGNKGGIGMSGTVVVNALPGGGGGQQPPGGNPPSTIFGDKVAPVLELRGAKSQRVLKQRGLVIRVESDEAATLTARASVTVPGASRLLRFRPVKRTLGRKAERKIKLRLSAKALATVRKALGGKSRLTARVTVRAKDLVGNVKTVKRKVVLRP